MYLAHISDDKKREQTLLSHLTGTARRAGEFADEFGCKEWGEGCGMLHDIGKYSQEFQRRLHGGPKVDHATAGAKELYIRKNIIQSYCVAGHHSGLPDGGTQADESDNATLQYRVKKQLNVYDAFQNEVQVPQFPRAPLKPLGKGNFSAAFFTRMLFSCLVDADYLDTEEFMLDGMTERGQYESIDVLYKKLISHVDSWLENKENNTVNGRRSAILRACLEKGTKEQGLYTLTVPTGGGKTISSLAFALQHAKKYNLNRIIYVIPYTSIIEQNAEVFKEILGENNVLENHCNVEYDNEDEVNSGNKMQLAAENWDCPVVVTTNVQFFESLFANKSSKCRKLHNIAKSVIIFDEAQMFPVQYLKPCVQAISELIYNYHCTAVLCSATQPALHPFFPEKMKAEEICPDVKGQFLFFERTRIESIGEITTEVLIDKLRTESQALCILNSRKRVQQIYEILRGTGVYHLSTLMYPKHRKKILKEIQKRLKNGDKCILIATSLVEAGMDFDFEKVYRELAGIDSVIQAAGRCNREGKRDKSVCITSVFTMERDEKIHIPPSLKQPVSVAQKIEEKYENIASLEAIQEYFQLLYYFKGEGLDAKQILGDFHCRAENFPFAAVAGKFHLIEEDTRTILIDVEEEAKEIVMKFRRGEYSRQLAAKAGQYCVNIYENDFERLHDAGKLEELNMGYFVLRNRMDYTNDCGLTMKCERGDGLFY